MSLPLSKFVKMLCTNKIVKKLEKETFKHAPELLITLGITGFVTGTVVAVKNTPKVVKKLEMEKQNLGVDKLKVKDVVRVAAPAYIPTLVMDGIAITAIIGSNRIKSKRYAALAAVYQLSSAAFERYKDNVVATIGEQKSKEIESKTVNETIAEAYNKNGKNGIMCIEGSGSELCYDIVSDRFFYSDRNSIEKAQNDFNADMISQGVYSSLNEFYQLLGLKDVVLGYDFGWDIDKGYLNVKITSTIAPNGKPCLAISYTPYLLNK